MRSRSRGEAGRREVRRNRTARGEAVDRGSITAEFATVVPAVVVVLLCCLAGMQLSARQLLLQDAAATAARSVARGDPLPPAKGSSLNVVHRGELVCVTATTHGVSARGAAAGGILGSVVLNASSCALEGGL